MSDSIATAFRDLDAETGAAVRIPPVETIESQARRRRARTRVAASTLAVVAVTGVTGIALARTGQPAPTDSVQPVASSSAGTAAPGTYRELVEQVTTETPARPVVVPRSLPAGYAMLNPYDYYPLRQGLPGIRVCVLPPGASDVRGTCVGTDDESPWIEIDADGLRVVIATTSPPELATALEIWRTVGFTANWQSIGWLDTQRPT